jgi:hypothetical protein
LWGPATGRPAATHPSLGSASLRAFACIVGPGAKGPGYRPLNCGVRFSMNARTPSR